MKARYLKIILCIFLIMVTGEAALFAKKKVLYINPFAIEQGLDEHDPIGETIASHMVSVFSAEGDYSITSQDSQRARLAQLELKQSFGEKWAKQLMKKMKADALVYGRVKKIGTELCITAKILKKNGSSMRLQRIKTIKIISGYPGKDKHAAEDIRQASRALATYLLEGDDDDIEDFLDDMYDRIEDEEENKEEQEIRSTIQREDRRFSNEIEQMARQKEAEILRYNSLLRFGYAGFDLGAKIFNKKLASYYPMGTGYFVDLILTPKNSDYRIEGTSTRAVHDFYLRVFYKHFEMGSDVEIVTTNPQPGDIISKGEINMYGCDLGYRYKFLQFYFLMTSFETYMLGAVRYQYYDETAANPQGGDDLSATFHSMGAYAGLGLELAFFENIGLFGEYNIGYTPVGESWANTEGHQIYFGITYRAEPFYY